MSKITSLCKRRGFIFQNSEIYGGFSGFWDFGPLGVELKNNIKKEWWRSMVMLRDDVVGLDSSIIINPQVWQASGHTKEFVDIFVECKSCKKRFRAEQFVTSGGRKLKPKCPECDGKLSEPRRFNIMFKTFVGPVEKEAILTYLRPETAQGIFINFGNILDATHLKIPFGIAQIGKVFRNEVTIENFVFRTREFEQAELEFFVAPKEDKKWFDYWRKERLRWFLDLGVQKSNIKLVDIPKRDLAHYSKATTELHYRFPFGKKFDEVEGIANRTDYDLTSHSRASKIDLSYFDTEARKRFIPYVIEPSLGLERAVLVFLLDAYCEEKVGKEKRVVLKLHPKLAPYKAAVFPLLANKPKLLKIAREIYLQLKPHFMTAWDDIGNIGKRYRRQDEIGTPFCLTIDFQTLEDGTVTLRDRDTMKQKRYQPGEIIEIIKEKI